MHDISGDVSASRWRITQSVQRLVRHIEDEPGVEVLIAGVQTGDVVVQLLQRLLRHDHRFLDDARPHVAVQLGPPPPQLRPEQVGIDNLTDPALRVAEVRSHLAEVLPGVIDQHPVEHLLMLLAQARDRLLSGIHASGIHACIVAQNGG